MSAQAGIWNFDGKPIDPSLLNAIGQSLKKQGPDGEYTYVSRDAALLYRPFHTTAESRRERQPYVSRRGFILTWDGRLDNRDELIAESRGCLDANSTDVAIVASAFDRWEAECFRHLVGDWALSVWKPQHCELFLALDYIAIRHLFYYLGHDQVLWASDLTPLVLHTSDKLHLDDDYLAGYFAHEPDAHLTPYREIREVPAGNSVLIRDGKAQVDRYWTFSSESRIRYKTDAEYEEHFRHELRASIKRRLRSDSPILAELSGGLDSSSIVCIADDIRAKEVTQIPRLDTISYYDKTEPHGDDCVFFPKIENKRGRAGFHIDASKVGTSPATLGSPRFSPLPGALGCSRDIDAKRAAIVRDGGYKVVLSGLGGDEFMGGVPDPTPLLADLLIQLKLLSFAKQLMAWSLVKRCPWIRLLCRTLAILLPTHVGRYFAQPAKIEPWICRDFARRTRILSRLHDDVDEHFGLWLPSRRLYIDALLLMAKKLAKYNSSSPEPEEPRYPYLDQHLVEFILSIPATQLLRPGERRSLMRRSLVGIVPSEILSRKTKQLGTRTPIVTLAARLEELEGLFAAPVSSQLGYVNNIAFMQQVNAALNGQVIHVVHLYRTVSLELWLRDLATRRLIAQDLMPNEMVREVPLDVAT